MFLKSFLFLNFVYKFVVDLYTMNVEFISNELLKIFFSCSFVDNTKSFFVSIKFNLPRF